MMTWNEIVAAYNKLRDEYKKLHKCLSVTKARTVTKETFDNNLHLLITVYNKIIQNFQSDYEILTAEHKLTVDNTLLSLRDKTLNLFKSLNIRILVPLPPGEIVETQVNASDSDSDHSDTHDGPNMVLSQEDFLGLAAKTISKNYEGDPLKLTAFINSIKLLVAIAGNTHAAFLTTFLMTKLDGKALEVVPAEPTTVDEIIAGLKNIKPETSKVVSSKMTSLRFDRAKVADFSEQAKLLGEALQRSLVIEGVSREKAHEMVIDKSIEMCRSNTRSDLVKAVLSATTYSDPDEVIAKLILESSKETQERQILAYKARFQNKRGRGRGRGQYHGNQSQYQGSSNSQQQQHGHNQRKTWNNRGRGRSYGNGRGNYDNRNVRVIEASGNSEAPQQYPLGEQSSLMPYGSR